MHETPKRFGGSEKVGRSLLSGPEDRLKKWAVPRIPQSVQTYHLTMMTLLWSMINMAVGFFVKTNLQLLWLVSLMILVQYLTDLFDGELGRRRETGLIRWGFYMDHFLDYIFLCSLVFVGYMLSPLGLEVWYFGLVVILGGHMVNSFLSFAATNEFRISYYGIGPTEVRLVFILVNTFIIFFGTGGFKLLVPAIVFICLAALLLNTFQIQRQLWRHDMREKQRAAR